jgi:hypothetical protein
MGFGLDYEARDILLGGANVVAQNQRLALGRRNSLECLVVYSTYPQHTNLTKLPRTVQANSTAPPHTRILA